MSRLFVAGPWQRLQFRANQDEAVKKRRSPKGSEKPGATQRLPRAELEVLACLWQRGEATAAEIREHLAGHRPMAHGSVLTLLKRLAAKKLVLRKKAATGKAFVYRAADRPDAIHRRILADLADRVFGGNRVAMIASLLDTHSPTQEELDEMKRLLDRFGQ